MKEIVKSINVRYIKADENRQFSNKLEIDIGTNHSNWFTEQRHRKFGRCYTTYPDKKSQHLGIYYIKFKL